MNLGLRSILLIVAIVCFAQDAERFDQVLVEARRVVQLDIGSDD